MPSVPPFVNPFDKEEERFIIYLKEKIGGGWDDLAERYAKRYPQNRRSKGGLQVHYSRSLQPGRKRRIELDSDRTHLTTSPTSDSATGGEQEEDDNSSDHSDFEYAKDDRARKQLKSPLERRAKLVKLKINGDLNDEMRVKHAPQSLNRPRRAAASGLKLYNIKDDDSESPVSADGFKLTYEIADATKAPKAGEDIIMTEFASVEPHQTSSSAASPVCNGDDLTEANNLNVVQTTEMDEAVTLGSSMRGKVARFEMPPVPRKDSVMNVEQYDDPATAKATSPTSYLRTSAVIDTGVWTHPSTAQLHTLSNQDSKPEATFKKPAVPAGFDLNAPPANSTRAKAIKLNMPAPASSTTDLVDVSAQQAAKDAARRLNVRERLGLLPSKSQATSITNPTLSPATGLPMTMNFKAPVEKLKPLIKRPAQDDEDNDGPSRKKAVRAIAIASREDPRLNPADDGSKSGGWVEANLDYLRKYGRDSLARFFLYPPASRVVEINVQSGNYRCKWRKEFSKDAIRSVGNIIVDDVFW